jgi:hypothetical protein
VYRYSRDKDKARQKLNELRTQADAVSLENITVSTLMDQWLELAAPKS